MKAREVLQRYKKGERDFGGKNLRCLSFKGENLSGANFSKADIRGTDFTKANLTGAKFEEAKAGLPKRWVIMLLFGCLVLLVISSFLALMLGFLVWVINLPEIKVNNLGQATLSLFLAFSFFPIYRGLNIVALVNAFTFPITIISGIVGVNAYTLAEAFPSIARSAIALAFIFVSLFAFFITIASGIVSIFTFAFASASAIARASAIAFPIAIAFPVAIAFAIGNAGGNAIVSEIAFSFYLSILLYSYLGWRAIKGHPRDTWIRTMAIAFAATGGSSFRGAILTDTDFTKATLKNTDFRDATLTRTCFKEAKKLDFARPGKTYLNIPQLQKLVLTQQGKDEVFDDLDCRGLNLAEANLENASFIGCDLDKAKLQGANLSRAKLIRVQLNDVDLTGAILTGACIEDWIITNRTKIEKVECKYVYMKFISGDKRDQMPPKGEFRKGEFVNFVKSILNTIDLYHDQNVDSQTVYAVIKTLATDYKEPLEIVGLEKRGDGAIVIKLKTSYYADQELIKEEYYQRYEQVFTLKISDPEKLLPDHEAIQEKLSKLIEEVKMKPTTYIKYIEGVVITGGTPTVTYKKNVGIDNTEGYIANSGDRSFNENAGVINEAEERNLAETAKEIQQLLEQLDKSYSTDTTAGKMAIATEAIKQIESNPTLMKRIISAAKAGSISALEATLNHPAASFVIDAIEDWKNNPKGD